MKIVVLDGYTLNPGDLDWKGLEGLGGLTVYDRTPEAETVSRIGGAEIVYTNKTPLTRQTLEACPQVKFIGVLATGYNVVDVQAAKERGIPVCNIPTYGTMAVAQYAIALLLELCHHIGEHSVSVAAGDWQKSGDFCYWKFPLVELDGKTLGVVGFGRIGRETAKIAAALGMKVLAHDARIDKSAETDRIKYAASLDQLLTESDVISLHVPLLPDTQGMINKDSIARMKNGVFIINTSRGPLINERDLADALNSGKVAAAAVDVVSVEPISSGNPLLTAKNCIITPHIAWAPKESRVRLMNIAVENLRAWLNGAAVNVVNM